jgi:DNA mismatch repair protein MutS2
MEKNKVVKEMAALLFNKPDQKAKNKIQKKIDAKYEEISGEIKPGDKVKMKRNQQIGEVLELRGKRAVVKIGLLPMQIDISDLIIVKEKDQPRAKT